MKLWLTIFFCGIACAQAPIPLQPLVVESPNSGDVYIRSTGNPAPPISLTPQQSKERWANISLYQRPPMRPRLSGLALEYAILEVYSRDAGQRSAKISFNVGQGSQ